jgi:hypothetical protein
MSQEVSKNLALSGISMPTIGDHASLCIDLSSIGNPTAIVIVDIESLDNFNVAYVAANFVSLTDIPIIISCARGPCGLVSNLKGRDFAENTCRVAVLREKLAQFSSTVEYQPTISIIGAICAQDIVKVVTGQKAPLDNTFVLDGLNLKSSVIKL